MTRTALIAAALALLLSWAGPAMDSTPTNHATAIHEDHQ